MNKTQLPVQQDKWQNRKIKPDCNCKKCIYFQMLQCYGSFLSDLSNNSWNEDSPRSSDKSVMGINATHNSLIGPFCQMKDF